MVKWKKLKTSIPNRVQLGNNSFYEILYVDDFLDGKTLGEMRPETKQIVIRNKQTPKNTVITFLHELSHAVSNECDLELTENQILKLEKSFYFLLKKGNIFKE